MSVLSQRLIRERLGREIGDESSLVITPLLDIDKVFDEDAVDVRLGTDFLLPRAQGLPYYSLDDKSGDLHHFKIHVPLGQYFVLAPHQTVLGATLEFIKLPYDVSGLILTKSSVARTFTIIETAPWVHPRYRGCLTLEISNGSSTSVILHPGRRIGQLVLMQIEGAQSGPLPLERTYFGPVYPEPPRFKAAGTDLERIGVRAVREVHGGVR